MKLIEAKIKRAFSMMVCLAVAVSALTVTAPAASAAEVYPTAWEITSEMTIGWNLGNSLDCTYWSDDPTPQQTATAWGNPEPTKALIDKVKALGFNTVRIPTTWYQHLSYDSATDTYLVDADWMTYVKNTVDFAYDNGMFVILNAHHENWANVDRFTDDTLAAVLVFLLYALRF